MNLRIGFPVDVRDRVIVVEHHRVEAELFKLLEFPIERLWRPSGRAIGVLAFADVPRAKAEFIAVAFCHNRESTLAGRAAAEQADLAMKAIKYVKHTAPYAVSIPDPRNGIGWGHLFTATIRDDRETILVSRWIQNAKVQSEDHYAGNDI